MKKYIFLLITSLCLGRGHAQVMEQLTPEERKQLTKVTEPITLYKGFFRVGLSTNFIVQDRSFDENGERKYVDTNVTSRRMGTILSFQYGITDRLELEAILPYVTGESSSSYTVEYPGTGQVVTDTYSLKFTGLGDALATFRYKVVNDENNTPGLTLGLGFNLPTGKKDPTDYKSSFDYNGAVAKGEFGIYPEIRLRKVSYPFSFEVAAAVLHSFGSDKIIQPESDPVRVTSGTEFLIRPSMNFHLNDWVVFTNYLDYYRASKDRFTGEDAFAGHNNEYNQWTSRWYPGLNFQVKRLRLEQAVLVPLAGKVVSADPSFYFIVQYMF